MNYLLELLNRMVGDEQLTRMLFAGIIGLSVVLVVATLAMLVKGLQSPVQRPGQRPPQPQGPGLQATLSLQAEK